MQEVWVKYGHMGVECPKTAEANAACVITRESIHVSVQNRRIVTSDKELGHSDAIRESQATPLDKGTVSELIWNLDQLDGNAVWPAPDPVVDQLIGILRNRENLKSNLFLASRKASQPKNLSLINITLEEAACHAKAIAQVTERLQQYGCNINSSEIVYVSDTIALPGTPYIKRFHAASFSWGFATVGIFADTDASVKAVNAYVLS